MVKVGIRSALGGGGGGGYPGGSREVTRGHERSREVTRGHERSRDDQIRLKIANLFKFKAHDSQSRCLLMVCDVTCEVML